MYAFFKYAYSQMVGLFYDCIVTNNLGPVELS